MNEEIWLTILDIIKKNMNLINKKYKVTHFEFINNSENWQKVEDFFTENGKSLVAPFSEFLKDENFKNSLTNELFWTDFKKIMESRIKSFKNKNYIYNKNDISEDNIMTTLNNMEFSNHSVTDYSYYIEGRNECRMDFSVSHFYNSLNFGVNLTLFYSPIGQKDQAEMNDLELNIYNYFTNNFSCPSGTFEINKKNIEQFCDGFLKDMNKLSVTSSMVIEKHDKKNKNSVKKSHSFLNEDYTHDKIISLLKCDENPDYTTDDVRSFYDPLTTLADLLCKDTMHSFLSSGIVNVYPSCKFGQFSIKIKDFYENPRGEDLIIYNFKIQGNKLEAYVDDVKLYEWHDIKNTLDISDQITYFIKQIFSEKLEEDLELKERIKKIITDNINVVFNEIPVDIIFPKFADISIDDFSNSTIPLTLVCGSEKFNQLLFSKLPDLLQNEELKTFKERIKIRSALTEDISNNPSLKKRI